MGKKFKGQQIAIFRNEVMVNHRMLMVIRMGSQRAEVKRTQVARATIGGGAGTR